MKLLINKKEREILIRSSITKDFNWFYRLLIKNKKITPQFVDTLNEKEKNFFKHLLPTLLVQAILEWKEKPVPPKDLGEDRRKWTKCTLCGTPNRYMHYIINRQNAKEINIGSECVKEYAFNDISTDSQRKEATKIRRLDILNSHLPGIQTIVDNWYKHRESYEIWIPDYMAINYEKIGDELKELYKRYINGKGKESDIERLQVLLKQAESEKNCFRDYVEKNKNNPFIITQKIYRWLNSNKNKELISPVFIKLKNEGVITFQNAYRISEQIFMEKISTLMNSHLQEIGFKIVGVEHLERNYLLDFISLNSCKCTISHKNLLINFGWKLFDEEEFTELNAVEFFKKSTVKDEKSIDIILRAIDNSIGSNTIKLAGYDFDFNEIVLFNKETKICKLLKLNEFVSKYKVLAITNDNRLEILLELEEGRTIDFSDYKQNRDGFTPLMSVAI